MLRPIALSVALLATASAAYPTSIVFAPTARSAGFLDFAAYGYSSLALRPEVRPDSSWFGLNLGLIPRFELWKNGPKFGGLELSFNLIAPWYYPGDNGIMKPTFSAKVELLHEHDVYLPSIAVGLLSLTPWRLQHSPSIFYVALTKTLAFGKTNLGTLTLGGGGAFNRDPSVFNGTAPFQDSRALWLAGYESPDFGPFALCVDAVSGYGEVSGLNAMLFIDLTPRVTLGFGGYFALERRPTMATADGFHLQLYIEENLGEWAKRAFSKKTEEEEVLKPPPPAEPPAPSPPPHERLRPRSR